MMLVALDPFAEMISKAAATISFWRCSFSLCRRGEILVISTRWELGGFIGSP